MKSKPLKLKEKQTYKSVTLSLSIFLGVPFQNTFSARTVGGRSFTTVPEANIAFLMNY